MIKFFRKIRYDLMEKNKTGKYFKYAIGEIVLVVIGILIAVSINNWNENRKQNQSIKVSIHSLINDLKRDTIQLKMGIKGIRQDLDMLTNFNKRLSSPKSTIDTLKHIARYEYLPFFDPSSELNRNTIVSLLSTGNMDYFNEKLKSEILSHNSMQLKSLKIMDQNISIFLDSQFDQGLLMQSEYPHPLFVSTTIKGPLLEKYWKNKDENLFLDAMLSKLSGKMLMDNILLMKKEDLLFRTNKMIEYLNNWEIEND